MIQHNVSDVVVTTVKRVLEGLVVCDSLVFTGSALTQVHTDGRFEVNTAYKALMQKAVRVAFLPTKIVTKKALNEGQRDMNSGMPLQLRHMHITQE